VEVHFRISRQYSIRLHQLGQSMRTQRISAARLDETHVPFFFFFINRVENLTGHAEAVSKKRRGKNR